jgi:hypothetical protein
MDECLSTISISWLQYSEDDESHTGGLAHDSFRRESEIAESSRIGSGSHLLLLVVYGLVRC